MLFEGRKIRAEDGDVFNFVYSCAAANIYNAHKYKSKIK